MQELHCIADFHENFHESWAALLPGAQWRRGLFEFCLVQFCDSKSKLLEGEEGVRRVIRWTIKTGNGVRRLTRSLFAWGASPNTLAKRPITSHCLKCASPRFLEQYIIAKPCIKPNPGMIASSSSGTPPDFLSGVQAVALEQVVSPRADVTRVAVRAAKITSRQISIVVVVWGFRGQAEGGKLKAA